MDNAIASLMQLERSASPIEGKIEGKLETGADMLRRLLTRRFGPLPAEVSAQIDAASVQQIEAWFDRSVDGSDLAQVFSSHRVLCRPRIREADFYYVDKTGMAVDLINQGTHHPCSQAHRPARRGAGR